jgi:heavy metal sensor kinase
VLATVLIIFGAVVFVLLSVSITAEIEETLITTADDILFASRRDVQGILLPTLDLTGNVGVQVWAWSSENDLALLSTNVTNNDEPFDTQSLNSSMRVFETVSTQSGRLRVLSVPITVVPDERIIGYLQLARSLDIVDRALEQLLIVLLTGGLLGILISALIGWAAAGAALRPLGRVTDTALQISRADDLSRRIPMEGAVRDEIGRLVIVFNETLERLENLFEGQRRFLADVSHELRTPLTTIRGNVDLIRRMGKADEESLEAVTAEVDRMTRMVQELLLLAQAESGNLPLAQETVDLKSLTKEIHQQAQLLAEGRVEVLINAQEPIMVVGDRDRLRQILLNLVANALEHTPDGGRIELGLERMEDWSKVTVTDSGKGIPEHELANVFERFYRGDRSRKRSETGGAGLGLSIAYWIARSHDGRIEVESVVGQGTTFSLWLPINPDDDNDEVGTDVKDTVELPDPSDSE